MNKGNKRDNIKKIEHKKLNKSKVVKISLSLFVVIIFAILFAVSLQISKTTKTGVEVSDNLAESATEEIIEDETTLNDDNTAISETTENGNTDDGISTIADSSDCTIIVTEYTEDTLEAEYYEDTGYLILYFIDGFDTVEYAQLGSYMISYSELSTTYLADCTEQYENVHEGYTMNLTFRTYMTSYTQWIGWSIAISDSTAVVTTTDGLISGSLSYVGTFTNEATIVVENRYR